ncbi:MAG: hypothetical protein ACD_83C00269G0002 [uncultured bacterium]|uniref:NYN domain-containing protein n=1 Tax=Berkelbacteria bacterium GW2011_GWA2_38_9 TaxID=1618334 RepID=A0A0G0LI54_9BACT|nr:MAG: hypothetical protein ACD_83C00269G0002 [uncultured bacterium]KKQ87595.1 MAG: hypothetical protein UT11_C0049G0007 [Berkelbacteria bacterium GW2011_GWA2_38_9]
MKRREQEKIYAFIDSQNLNLAIRGLGWKLDFQQFYIYLKDKLKVKKAFLFIGYIPKNQELYSYLKQAGYQIIFKPVLNQGRTQKDHIKGNVDAELVLHSMIEYSNYDKAVIVSGDGDFYCLIDYLQKKNKLSKLIIPNSKKYSKLLFRFRNKMVFINRLQDRLAYKNKTISPK